MSFHFCGIIFVGFSVFVFDLVEAVDAVIVGYLAFSVAVGEAFSDDCSNVVYAVGSSSADVARGHVCVWFRFRFRHLLRSIAAAVVVFWLHPLNWCWGVGFGFPNNHPFTNISVKL